MTQTAQTYLAIATAAIAACACALLAGNVSEVLAQVLLQRFGAPFLREPLNAGIALALLWGWQKWRPAGNYSPPKWGRVAIGLGLGGFIGAALPMSALVIMSVLGVATLKGPTVEPHILAIPVIFVVIHGLAEESLIRGIAQREGHTYFGPLAGVCLAALSFAVLQGLQGYVGLVQICNSALFGGVLGFLALGPGGIWTAVGAHAGWTWLETTLLGGSGQIVKSSSWLAGMGHDSYGSPLFSIVLIIVLCGQYVLHRRTQRGIG